MKKKIIDEGHAGIIGTVKQNLDGHLLVEVEFLRKKDNTSIYLNNKKYVWTDADASLTTFVGDRVRLEKTGLVNLTVKHQTCAFKDLLSREEFMDVYGYRQSCLFNGVVEALHVKDNAMCLRFRVISRINNEGRTLKVNKLVHFVSDKAATPQLNNRNNALAGKMVIVPIGEVVTLRYYRKYDQETKVGMPMIDFKGINAIEDAKKILEEKC